ncbi:MAG: DUF695 domain-containing protein [Pseudomonadota bacterium]
MKTIISIGILLSTIALSVSAETPTDTREFLEQGRHLYVRSLTAIPTGVAEADFPHLVSISWEYQPSKLTGLPHPSVDASQREFEAALAPLGDLGASHLAVTVLGNGRREWHWYVRDVSDWMAALNRALKSKPIYPIRIRRFFEPDWALFKRFRTRREGI